jgi:hypothetical protein
MRAISGTALRFRKKPGEMALADCWLQTAIRPIQGTN